MFRMNISGESFILRRETNYKEYAIFLLFFMIIEVATKFKAIKFRITHN